MKRTSALLVGLTLSMSTLALAAPKSTPPAKPAGTEAAAPAKPAKAEGKTRHAPKSPKTAEPKSEQGEGK
ncbi:hypothetical protein P2318_32090 [Myxococcaceae bacterium GXIMD 01537]